MGRLFRLEPVDLVAGVDDTIVIALYDSNNDLLSVTGKTAEWKLYRGVARRGRKPFRGAAILTKTSAAGDIALSDGSATVTITDSDLASYAGQFWQAIEITTTSGGAIAHHGQGPVRLRAGI